jgi:hypothetical protein
MTKFYSTFAKAYKKLHIFEQVENVGSQTCMLYMNWKYEIYSLAIVKMAHWGETFFIHSPVKDSQLMMLKRE